MDRIRHKCDYHDTELIEECCEWRQERERALYTNIRFDNRKYDSLNFAKAGHQSDCFEIAK